MLIPELLTYYSYISPTPVSTATPGVVYGAALEMSISDKYNISYGPGALNPAASGYPNLLWAMWHCQPLPPGVQTWQWGCFIGELYNWQL